MNEREIQSKEYHKAYREAHREERRAARREYYRLNRDKELARGQAYRAAHPEVAKRSRAKCAQDPISKRAKIRREDGYRDRRRAMVSIVSLHYGCRNPNCEMTHYTPEILDFHHIGKDKEFMVSQSLQYTLPKLAAEMNKCVVLCSNCHKQLHARRFTVDESMLCHVDDELKPILTA